MSGQYWPEGDEVYHAELTVPILLVHGLYDKFVPMDEDQRMAEVRWNVDNKSVDLEKYWNENTSQGHGIYHYPKDNTIDDKTTVNNQISVL